MLLPQPMDRLRAWVLRASLKYAPSEPQRVLGVTIALGGLCGMIAVGFHKAVGLAQSLLIDPFVPGKADVSVWVPMTLLVPAVGGLLAGLMIHFIAPNARGSGVPDVKVAFAIDARRLGLRSALAKFAVCVVQLGTGASLGREGPTVNICAGVASSIGRWFALSPANLQRLLPVGAAAGIAAAFNAPIAAVTFTIEEIVGRLDQTVLAGVVSAAALAAVVEHSMLGTHPVLEARPAVELFGASSLLPTIALGIIAAGVSIAFTDLILDVRARARASRIPDWATPAIGGLVTGGLAVVALYFAGVGGIEGAGYQTLGRMLRGELVWHVLLMMCVLKLFATVACYGTGSAGGIFAPTLFLGAALGGAVGAADASIFGHPSAATMSSFALVGMGAMFAGVLRAPITSVLIIFEMTGSYDLVLPLMIANTIAYAIAHKIRPRQIYEALLDQDGVRLPRAIASPELQHLDVGTAMTRNVATMPAEASLEEAIAIAKKYDHSTYPVLDPDGKYRGLISEGQLARARASREPPANVGALRMRKEFTWTDEALFEAVRTMTKLGVRQLPVLERDGSLVGILAMTDVLRAQVRARDGRVSYPATPVPEAPTNA